MSNNYLKFGFLSILLTSFVACSLKTDLKQDQVNRYYKGLKNSDFTLVKTALSDSIDIKEGDYVMRFSRDSYYEHFKWDSVFKPVYELKSVVIDNGNPVATISVASRSFEFLGNNPLVSKQKFYFESGKIRKIENLDFIEVDWEIWENRKTALLAWIALNYPQMSAFINELNVKGAINYLKTIELYENRDY